MPNRTVDEDGQPKRLSRRSLLLWGAAGIGLAATGAAAAVSANLPEMSARQQGLPPIPDWTAEDMPLLQGRSALVTGGNGYPEGDRSGLGYHIALQLARAGADVVIASRRQERGAEAVRRIKAQSPGANIRFETLDLSSLDSVANFAERLKGSRNSLDILVNNAGVMGRLSREISVDGFERVFATNALGPFALTARLMPLLQNGASPRIVWMASSRGALGELNFDDLQKQRRYDYAQAYNDSKLADLMLAFACARHSTAFGWNVSSFAVHPGVARTNIVLDGPGLDSPEGWRFRHIRAMWRDPAIGALPALYAATAPQAQSGAYYGPAGALGMGGLPGWAGIPAKAEDEAVAARLWATLEHMANVQFGQRG